MFLFADKPSNPSKKKKKKITERFSQREWSHKIRLSSKSRNSHHYLTCVCLTAESLEAHIVNASSRICPIKIRRASKKILVVCGQVCKTFL